MRFVLEADEAALWKRSTDGKCRVYKKNERVGERDRKKALE